MTQVAHVPINLPPPAPRPPVRPERVKLRGAKAIAAAIGQKPRYVYNAMRESQRWIDLGVTLPPIGPAPSEGLVCWEDEVKAWYASVSFPPGTGPKRFAGSMTAIEAGDAMITEKQAVPTCGRSPGASAASCRPAAEPARPGATRTPNELRDVVGARKPGEAA